jgi:hypothetical protein
MTYGTMERIQTVTVGSGGAANIEFTNIPQTYSDLYILLSLRSNDSRVTTWVNLQPNGSTANGTSRQLYGNGSSAISGSLSRVQLQAVPANNATASTFGNASIYISNYTSSNNKSFSGDSVSETNATSTEMAFDANLWSNSAAITSFKIVPGDGTAWMQHSTATLYGITRVPAEAKATGGVIYDDSSYWYHVFTSSGTFTPSQSITADCLVIAGGGSGGFSSPGGGGAGGLLAHTNQLLTATNYTVTVGGGGAGVAVAGAGTKGSNSQFWSLTASEGGGAGRSTSGGGVPNGGSGGGGAESGANSAGGTATAGQGFNGGNNNGGGGGAGQAGAVGYGSGTVGATGLGGDGVSTYSSWGLATNTGENISGTVWYAGGGGGYAKPVSAAVPAAGGNGGGGDAGGSGLAGMANTGGGSGADSQKAGGSGIVIVRYAK